MRIGEFFIQAIFLDLYAPSRADPYNGPSELTRFSLHFVGKEREVWPATYAKARTPHRN
jgi:hypothetical protein